MVPLGHRGASRSLAGGPGCGDAGQYQERKLAGRQTMLTVPRPVDEAHSSCKHELPLLDRVGPSGSVFPHQISVVAQDARLLTSTLCGPRVDGAAGASRSGTRASGCGSKRISVLSFSKAAVPSERLTSSNSSCMSITLSSGATEAIHRSTSNAFPCESTADVILNRLAQGPRPRSCGQAKKSDRFEGCERTAPDVLTRSLEPEGGQKLDWQREARKASRGLSKGSWPGYLVMAQVKTARLVTGPSRAWTWCLAGSVTGWRGCHCPTRDCFGNVISASSDASSSCGLHWKSCSWRRSEGFFVQKI